MLTSNNCKRPHNDGTKKQVLNDDTKRSHNDGTKTQFRKVPQG